MPSSPAPSPDRVRPDPRQIEEPNGFAQDLFTGLPRRYDRLAELLSMGQNGRWRRAMVDAIAAGAKRRGQVSGTMLDVATGTAGVALQLAERTPYTVVGIDLTEAMLNQGHANVRSSPLADRIKLTVGRGEQLPFPDDTFDALTFTYLLRYVDDPQATVTELARVVRPGGRSPTSSSWCRPTCSGGRGGGGSPASCCRWPAWPREGRSGTGWDDSSGRAFPGITAAIPSIGRWTPGMRRGWSTCRYTS